MYAFFIQIQLLERAPMCLNQLQKFAVEISQVNYFELLFGETFLHFLVVSRPLEFYDYKTFV